jgi:hypothetical protein
MIPRATPWLTGFLLGIIHDRRLMREAHVNLAIRWFASARALGIVVAAP